MIAWRGKRLMWVHLVNPQKRYKLSFLQARNLKKIGYFKLPKVGHLWVDSSYTWARVTNKGEVVLYTERYLANTSLEQLSENWIYINNRDYGQITNDRLSPFRKSKFEKGNKIKSANLNDLRES